MRTKLIAVLILVAAACGDAGATPSGEEPDLPVVGTGEGGFVGLTIEAAQRRAEEQGRPWRIGDQDGEEIGVTADFVFGRVTLDVEDGIVVDANIEHENGALAAAAVLRLLTVDNSFGGSGNPFDRVLVAEFIGGYRNRPLGSFAVATIASELTPAAPVEVVADAGDEISKLFEADATGIAVVAVDDMRVDFRTAEVDLTMWCGTLCGVILTYAAEHTDVSGWVILGPVGEVAVS